MKKLNYHMLIQWVIFMPLILTMSIVTGAISGIRKSMESLYDQLLSDLNSEVEID